MAKYDYHCNNCGYEVIDHVKGMTEPHPPCPDCDGKLSVVYNTSASVGNTGFCPSRPTGVLTNKVKK